jgi:hypothetical protein
VRPTVSCGAGCYPGYRDWHVPALIVLAVEQLLFDEKRSYKQSVVDMISPRMWFETDNRPQEAMVLVTKINPSGEDVNAFINETTEAISRKLSLDEEDGWNRFMTLRDQRKILRE